MSLEKSVIPKSVSELDSQGVEQVFGVESEAELVALKIGSILLYSF